MAVVVAAYIRKGKATPSFEPLTLLSILQPQQQNSSYSHHFPSILGFTSGSITHLTKMSELEALMVSLQSAEETGIFTS